MPEPITARGVQSAVAMVTARSAGIDVPAAQILGDTPAEEALAALVVLTATFMGASDPAAVDGVLRRTGVIAANAEADQQ